MSVLLPASSPLSRGAASAGSLHFGLEYGHEHHSFHEHGIFFAIWLLVMFVGVDILTKARGILEPILWAFFLMMGLVPLTDVVERLLLRAVRCCQRSCGVPDDVRRRARRRKKLNRTASARSAGATTRSRPVPGREESYKNLGEGSGLRSPLDRHGSHGSLEEGDEDGESSSQARGEDDADSISGSDEDVADSGLDAVAQEEGRSCSEKGGCARTIAVLFVFFLTAGSFALFFIMVYKSAVHMQDSWPHYQRGAANIGARSEAWMKSLPDDLVQKVTKKALSGMETALETIVSGAVEATTHTLTEIVWVLLYMIFWLCQPVHIGKDVSTVFRRYIFLKGIASGGYAFCIWILLHFIGVDLAIVFGLITFVFNFIPEVGPFIAMMLPLPVILFDDRSGNPLQLMVLALVGQLSLKVVFGNIVEIKLIESQQEMRMHPVVILFFVAFFQYIWGATGMLLSVPIVAALKATLHKIPPAYRNPILIFLEGDKTAPARWHQWRKSLRAEDSLVVE